MTLAVVVVGMPASGKDFARHYAEQNGMNYLSTGDIVRLECASRGLDVTADNLAMVSNDLRQQDPAELTRWLLDRVERDMKNEPVVIMEGMRSWEEIELIRSKMDVVIIAFVVGRSLRRGRCMARGRGDDDPTRFDERDRREISYGTAIPVALADYYVLNSGSLEETADMLNKVMEDVLFRA